MYSVSIFLHFTYLGGAYAPNAPPLPTGLERVLKDGESASWPLEGMDDQYDKLASLVCSVGHKSTN